MKSTDLLTILEENVAPVALSNEYCKKFDAYDNSGLIIDNEGEINGILFSLDFSVNAVKKAIELGYNAIVTHHPAIYGGINRLYINTDPQAKAIAMCIKAGICVISMHLNFDTAVEGIDHYLMEGLGGSKPEIMHKMYESGYGRVYGVESKKFADYVEFVKANFNSQRIVCYGDENKIINKVASFCGGGCMDESINFAVNNGADCVVTSDMQHHRILALVERGINVIHIPHYTSEVYGFNKISQKIIKKVNVPTQFFRDLGLQ